MFAITPSDIEYHINECCQCAVLARVKRMGATGKTLVRAIREIHNGHALAA